MSEAPTSPDLDQGSVVLASFENFQLSYVDRLREGKLARLEMSFGCEQALKAVGLTE